jgi:hypothetical protein
MPRKHYPCVSVTSWSNFSSGCWATSRGCVVDPPSGFAPPARICEARNAAGAAHVGTIPLETRATPSHHDGVAEQLRTCLQNMAAAGVTIMKMSERSDTRMSCISDSTSRYRFGLLSEPLAIEELEQICIR